MKARKVVVSVEVNTNLSIKDLKAYVIAKLNKHDIQQIVEVKQIQINVVKK